jgi:antitoxin Phd
MESAEKGRVLIVEPNPQVLHSYSSRLSKAGFQVAEASEAKAALRSLENAQFDLLISDLKLPKSDGLALLRRLRLKFVDLQFVLLLEAPDNQRAVEAAELGAFQSLIKPIRPDILEKTAALAMRLKRERVNLQIAPVRRFSTKSASVSATEAKNEFGRLLEKAMQGDIVVITKHDAPKAVLLSMAEFETLSQAPESRINTLSAEFDALLARMQGPSARDAMHAAFSASPEQLGKAAVAAARKRA